MPNQFAAKLKQWRGDRRLKEAARLLGIDYGAYRLYETGKRTPGKLARIEIERRMAIPASLLGKWIFGFGEN